MIEKHLDEIDRIIKDDSLVFFSDIQKVYTSPNSTYIKAEVRFIGNTLLNLFQHIRFKESKPIINYRYHYMDSKNNLIFRYDNAPHYPNVSTFPHHKHILSGMKESEMPSIENLITEIHRHIIRRIISNL